MHVLQHRLAVRSPVGLKEGRALPTSLAAPLSPPIVRSLSVGRVEDVVASHALYVLLTSSPSITNACLTRISVRAVEQEDVRMFAIFANLGGAALRDVELHVDRNIRLDRKHVMLHSILRVNMGLIVKLHPFL